MEPKVELRCYRRGDLCSSISCGDFTKDVESLNTGLVQYDNFLHAEKTKSSENVITLQNRKDLKLSPWNTQRSFENCIETCPRCINICAKRLLKNVSTLGKRKTLGVCSHCGIKIQTDPSHSKCNVIFKKFLTSSAKDLDIDENNIKTCPSKPHRFTTGFFKNEEAKNCLKLQTHLYSDSYLNRVSKKYYAQKSSQKPTDGSQVKIRPLFQSELDLSKLYITPTYHSFLQEQKALSFRKTRLRIRKQLHDQTFQFHFIFPSEKKDLDSRLQVSSSQLLHDFQANRKTNIHEKKNLSAKTNKQTLPWQPHFSISSLQRKSIEFLHDIHAKYEEIKTLKDKILEQRRSRDLEKKNPGAKTNKKTLPWQSDFSLLSLEGKALELLHDIRAKYKETKILEDKILDIEKKNLGLKTNKKTLPWQRGRDSSLLGLEGNYEFLHDIRGKYRKTKILENKILAERRSSDLEMKNRGAKTNQQTLPRQTDSSLLSLKENSLELLNNIQAKYENKKRHLELIRDLEKKSLGTKTKRHRWQKGYSLLSGEYLPEYEDKKRQLEKQHIWDLENNKFDEKKRKHRLSSQKESSILHLEVKYEEKERHLEEQRNRDLETKKYGAKTKDNGLPLQKDSSLLHLEAKYEKKERHLEEQRNHDLETKKRGAKTKDNGLPWQKDSSLLYLEAKYEKKERHLEVQRNQDLETKKRSAKTKDNGLTLQKDSSLLYLEAKYEKKERHLEEQRNHDLETKKRGAKTKDNGLPLQKDSSLLYLEAKYEKKERHLEEQRNRDLETKKHRAKTKDNGLPLQKDSSLLYLKAKYEKEEIHLEKQHSKDLENKKLGAKTKRHELWQKYSPILSIEVKREKKKRRLEDQLSRDLERTESKNLGVITKKYKLPRQKKDSAHLNLEEETATITQANVISNEQTEIYHKKKHGLNKKDDSFNELNDSNSEINGRVVRKTSKEIEESRKKKQAILEMLIRVGGCNINGKNLTISYQGFRDTKSTELPTEKAVRKMNVYHMDVFRPEFNWFAKNKVKRKMFYESGEIFAEFSEDGCGRWFYRDGKLALDYYNTEKNPPGRRYVLYSSEKRDRNGRPRPQTILGSFDHSGNAVVFDHAGNIRLKYDQNEGVVLDHSIGPESHWKWHSLNNPPASTDKETPFIDRMHKLKLHKSVHEKSIKMTQPYKQFEIKMKALKINEKFSLKILDQAKVYLIYRDGTTHIKINVGMTLNSMKKVDIVTCYVDDVFNPLEKFPADTQSVVTLQRMVAQARHAEHARVRRQGRLMRSAFV